MKTPNRLLTTSLYLLPFFLPSYLVNFSLASSGSINLLDVYQSGVLLIFFGSFFKENVLTGLKLFIRERKAQIFFLLLLGLGLLTSLFFAPASLDLTSSLGLIKSYFVLPIGVALVIAYLIHQRQLNPSLLFFAYFLYASLLGLGGLYFLATHQLTFDNRLTFFFNSPNYLAMAIAPGLLIGTWYMLKDQLALLPGPLSLTQKKYTMIILLIAQGIALIATQSLGAFLAAAIALGGIFFSKHLRKLLLASLIMAFFTLLTLFLLPPLLSWVHYQPTVPATSFDSRLAIYQTARKITADHWLTGIGPGNFQTTYLDYQRFFPPYPQWAVPHAHHLLLHIWTELGIVSLMAFLGVIFLHWKKNFPLPESPLVYALVVYLVIHGLVDMSIWKNDLAQWFWILMLL